MSSEPHSGVGALLPRDIPAWQAAFPWLDVRSNDVHTLISYRIARALLALHETAHAPTVCTAIIFHDVGWKKIPVDKLAASVGPNPKYPELQRVHELEGVEITRPLLQKLQIPDVDPDTVLAIIDGHDTRKHAISLEDALMKDADKLWRFTAHGVANISRWFEMTPRATVAMLEDFVLPSLLTEPGKIMAQAYLAEGEAAVWLDDMLAAGIVT
jgi:hypothetical protein